MTLEEFAASIKQSQPPNGLSPLLKALWFDGKNDWEMAHNIAQDVPSADGSWIHAFLHRREGDEGNAAYWYRRAGRPVAHGSLQEEWQQIAKELLSRETD